MTDSSTRAFRVAVCADLNELNVETVFDALTNAGHTVVPLNGGDRDAIIAEAADADALMLGYGLVDADVLDALPRLRMIALASMGYNNVDISAAHARGVKVSNIVGAATEEVATHALALTLDTIRHVSAHDRAVREGHWDLERASVPRRMSELILGVVGLGRIGAAYIDRARPLFGSVIGYDPFLSEERAREMSITLSSLDTVLETADIVSLHLPLTEDTENLINETRLARMRPGAVLINVSRGGLIDPVALRNALDTGAVSAAGLDVLDVEPPQPDHPLLNHPNVTITPHTAFVSGAALADYVRLQAENILVWARTGEPLTPIPA